MIAASAALAMACSTDGPIEPPPPALRCNDPADGEIGLPLGERFAARVIAGDGVQCFDLIGSGARYLIMPQLTGATLPYGGYGFRIGDPDALPAVASLDAAALVASGHLGTAAAGAEDQGDAQGALHALLRAREATARRPAPARPSRMTKGTQREPIHALESLRQFSVLNTLDATPAFSAVGARLRFDGARVAIYLDTLADGALTPAELTAMGTLYDSVLAPRMFDAFGAGSDVDANGKVIFLLTPTVNAMVTSTQCAAMGYVRGFFYGHDLASAAPTSNAGEVFYAYVPDPVGAWSCAHATSDVLANLPPTFVHEMQHMISYGEHVVVRGGASEAPWLNEGLSHLAEELGSRYWEERFPAPSGRTDPAQLFPDAASPYITPNLLSSYRYLFGSGSYSLTGCAPGSFCSQTERGGIWLFLRWLVDQKGPTTSRQLVQTVMTGRDNLEAVAGESTAALLASFAIAVSADSLEGVPRAQVMPRFQFDDRNLRRIYRKLFEAYGIGGGVGRPFPIAPTPLDATEARTGTMRPGTFSTFLLQTPSNTASVRLRFSIPDGTPFPATSGAQVAVFRIH